MRVRVSLAAPHMGYKEQLATTYRGSKIPLPMKLKQESKLIMEYEKRPVNIKGWEMYQVDTDGNVYGKNGKKLKYSLNHNGYCIVNFYHNHIRKGFGVHTIVALTFIENNNPLKTQVNHKMGIKKKIMLKI